MTRRNVVACRHEPRTRLHAVCLNHGGNPPLLLNHTVSTLLLLQDPLDEFLLVEIVEVLSTLQILNLVLLLEQADLFALVNFLDERVFHLLDQVTMLLNALLQLVNNLLLFLVDGLSSLLHLFS